MLLIVEDGKISIRVFNELSSTFIVKIGRIRNGRSSLKVFIHILIELLSIKEMS